MEDLLTYLDGQIRYSLTPFPEGLHTVEAVARYLKIEPRRIAKAMAIQLRQSRYAIAVLPGNRMLSLKATCRALGVSKAELLRPDAVSAELGLEVGAVTPLIALKRPDIAVIMDSTLLGENFINISSGDPRVGVDVCPSDLRLLLNPVTSILARSGS